MKRCAALIPQVSMTMLLFLVPAAAGVMAQDVASSDLTVTVTEIRPAIPYEIGATRPGEDLVIPALSRDRGPTGAGEGLPIDLDTIIRIGREVWLIIKENQPTAEMNYASAAAIPQGITSWEQMSGWNPHPSVRTFRIKATGALGGTVAEYAYTIIAVHGGGYQGKGQYLQDVRVIASEIYVAWGNHVDASVEVLPAFNIGQPGNPVAALGLIHRFKIRNVLQHYECAQHFVIRGDGPIEQTGGEPVR